MQYDLATAADDADLRQLLRDHPLPGALSLSFEREPSYFGATAIEGPFHQTLIGRHSVTGVIHGMGSRAVRPLYVNGEVQSIGYMSLLRVNLGAQWGLVLARLIVKGFAFLRALHADGRAPFYLMSVVAHNHPARRLLTSGIAAMPQARAYTRLFTYAIAPHRTRPSLPLPAGWRLEPGSAGHQPALLACLQRSGRRHQFTPHWSADTLFDPTLTPGLTPEDFFLALWGEEVQGCLALWDQQACKQTVVRGYAGPLAHFRKLLNWCAPLGAWPVLPEVGTRLNQCFACFPAVTEDDPEIFAALLRAVYNEAHRRGHAYLVIGLAEGHPWHALLKAYRPVTYMSQIYLLAWEDGLDALAQVDGRTPGLEIAVL